MKRILIITLILLLPGAASLRAQTKKKPAAAASGAALKASIARGQEVYSQTCISCHQANGAGVPRMNPPLIKTPYVLGDKTRLIKIVLNGFNEEVEINGEYYSNPMPAFKTTLNDQQIADVLTYVRNSFQNKASAVSPAQVKAVRAQSN